MAKDQPQGHPDQPPGSAGDRLARTIQVRVVPRSRRESVEVERDGRVVVRTSAAPVDGAANARVVALLCEHYGVRRREVEIVTGQHSRDKVIRITGAPRVT